MSSRTQGPFWQRILGYALIGVMEFQNTAWAELTGGIATDGTMGATQTLSGVNVTVPQSLGSTAGNNLFHSFYEFNIAPGQTVEFTGSNALQNVISRVTGTDVTNIEGTLKSSIANAAFYFINPNGITFGAGAQVNVPGAFHVSTADKIDFPNNAGAFYADSGQASTLSSEAPAAFGFLETSAVNNGLIEVNGVQLTVKTEQTLDVVAGEIKLENNAGIKAPAGEIRLVAMQDSGSVSLEQTGDGVLPLPNAEPSPTNAGLIAVNSGNLDAGGNGGGRIALWAGNTLIKDSKAQADNTGAKDATSAKGVDLRSYALSVDNSSVLSAALATGKTGDVTVEVPGSLNVVNAATVGSTASAQGDAGNVTVTANTLKIDSQGKSETGIGALALAGSTGQVGNVSIKAGAFDILNGGVVSSSTFGLGNAGSIKIKADSLMINSQGFISGVTGIASQAELGSSGHAGDLTIQAGKLDILSGGGISSSTFAQGDAGNVKVTADTLRIDGQQEQAAGIASAAAQGSSGHAGNVTVQAGTLDILNNGIISSDTLAQGNAGNVNIHAGTLNIQNNVIISSSTIAQGDAGSVTVTADTLKIDGQAAVVSGIFSMAGSGSEGQAGSVVVRSGALVILNGGKISSSTRGKGDAGSVTVTADALTIDSQGFSSWVTGILSQAEQGSSGHAGNVTIQAGMLNIFNGGEVTSSTFSKGDAGSVAVTADALTIDSQGFSSWATGILSQAEQGSSGQAGNVTIQAGMLDIFKGGEVASSTFSEGDAGSVAVTADTLTIDGQGWSGVTGIASQAEQGSSGHAGDLTVQAGNLDILNGGAISSSTFTQGDAGNVKVSADTLTINRQGSSAVTAIASQAEQGSSGHAGDLTIQAGKLDILNGGAISSSTFAQGDAGSIKVIADILRIDGQQGGPTGIASLATVDSDGHAGNVTVQAGTLDILNNGIISSDTLDQGNAGNVSIQAGTLNIFKRGAVSSSTFAEGDAGSVTVTADALRIDGQQERWAGIASGAGSGSTGQAGNIIVKAGMLDILNGGKILSSTQAQGGAGSVIVEAGTVAVNSGSFISSGSQGIDSSGKTGDVAVTASDWLHLADGGRISIENDSDVPVINAELIQPGSITVTAPTIDMKGSEITSNSTGNVAAGNIVLNFSGRLTMEPSFISTTANTGNGGSITINGGEVIYLQDSGFRTTVSGADSNGGDIFTKADILVMNTGLIQANAVGGSGGNINLNLSSLIPSGNTLIKGGSTIAWQPFQPGFNVIQAASQAGVSGVVNVTAPQLNLSGILANLGGPQFDTSIISQDYCGLGTGSSLTRKGSGGLQPKSGDQLLF